MSSTTSSPAGGFLSSPRMQQRLVWISGAVLLIGIAVFLGVFLSRGSSQPANQKLSTIASGPPTKSAPATKNAKVKPSPDALKAAHTFLETAVVRKDLGAAYAIVGPDLKGGISLAAWRKGNIPVPFYPAANAKLAELKVKSSHKTNLWLQTVLFPRKGSGVRPLVFDLNVDRIGGKWLVNYINAEYSTPVLAKPNN
jgi:hypothetical protein